MRRYYRLELSDSERMDMIKYCELEPHLRWFAECNPPYGDGELAWEIGQFPEDFRQFAAYLPEKNVPVTMGTGMIDIHLTAQLKIATSNNWVHLTTECNDMISALKLIRIFKIRIQNVVISSCNDAKVPANRKPSIPQAPALPMETKMWAIPPEIIGIIGEFLWNCDYGDVTSVRNLAMTCKEFYAGPLSGILRKFSAKCRRFAGQFLRTHCFGDIKVMRNIADAASGKFKTPLLVPTSYLYSGAGRCDPIFALPEGAVVDFVNDDNITITHGNDSEKFQILHYGFAYREKFTKNIMKKYSGSRYSGLIFLILWHEYRFIVHGLA